MVPRSQLGRACVKRNLVERFRLEERSVCRDGFPLAR
jgi:hypothetical protein